MTRGWRFLSLILLLIVAACGKKGPPLPPLVRVPTPPGDFSAQRRGSDVTVQFVVPGGNTDGSTPADLTHVDVYALNASEPPTADEIFRRGKRIGTVPVNPPPDPDAPEGEPAKPSGPVPEGGIDQAAIARLHEAYWPEPDVDASTDLRMYMAVGFNKRGRRGSYSLAAGVPLAEPPSPPGQPEVTWDETTITVTWPVPETDDADATLLYNVYAPGDVPTRLTSAPLEEGRFADKRIEWGAERCYIVRTMEMFDKRSLESDASPSACVTLTDTFPPQAPEGLTVVASEGAMNLIWNANSESDVAGYLLFRAVPADGPVTQMTPMPIKETTFQDSAPAGTRVAYALQAVDKAGNTSPMSHRVEETAR